MKKIQWILGSAISICVVIILLITSFELVLYVDYDVYQREYEKYDVLSDLDMTMEDTMYVTREMMAYLRGNREELSVVTTVEGKEQDFFNEQDRFHMGEVQDLFIGGLHLRSGAAVVLVLCFAVLLVMKRQKKTTVKLRQILGRSYQAVLGILAALLLLLGIAIARNFNAVFTLFHEIFFDNDLWLFDPATDYMIRMLPEGFFYDIVLLIGGCFAVMLVILLFISVLAVRKRREDSKDN